jgi:hypothetical protein
MKFRRRNTIVGAKGEMLECYWMKFLFQLKHAVVEAKDKDTMQITHEIGKVPEKV